MLSKVFNASKGSLNTASVSLSFCFTVSQRREFGVVSFATSKIFNTVDASTTSFGVVTHDTSVPLEVSI